MWGRNARRLSELEDQVAALRKQLKMPNPSAGSTAGNKPVTTRSRVGAIVLITIYTVVFGVVMYVAILAGPADGKASVVALIGAIAVAVSVICANAMMLINEWENTRKNSLDSILTMCAIGTGAIGSMLVIAGLL